MTYKMGKRILADAGGDGQPPAQCTRDHCG